MTEKPLKELTLQDIELMRLAAYMDSREQDMANFANLLDMLREMQMAHIAVRIFTDGETIIYEAQKKRPIGFGTDMK